MRLNLEKIEKELKRRNWKKYRLATEMGVRHQWIYQVLSPNYSGMTLKTIEKIAWALDYDDPKDLII